MTLVYAPLSPFSGPLCPSLPRSRLGSLLRLVQERSTVPSLAARLRLALSRSVSLRVLHRTPPTVFRGGTPGIFGSFLGVNSQELLRFRPHHIFDQLHPTPQQLITNVMSFHSTSNLRLEKTEITKVISNFLSTSSLIKNGRGENQHAK